MTSTPAVLGGLLLLACSATGGALLVLTLAPTRGVNACLTDGRCEAGANRLSLSGCGLTDDDLDDIAACFDSIGRENLEQTVQFHSTGGVFNRLENLPSTVFAGMVNLQVIELRENSLQQLPAGLLDNMPALNAIGLRNNKLESLPSGFFQGAPNVQRIYLQDNQITSLPIDIFAGLPITLMLATGNLLECFPPMDNAFDWATLDLGELDTCANTCLAPGNANYRCDAIVNDDTIDLNECALTDNDFVELKACIYAAGRIGAAVSELRITGNPLFTTLPEDLFDDSSFFRRFLTDLRLGRNNLKALPEGIFDPLWKLENLDLGDNNLRTLPLGIFGALETLTWLNLEVSEATHAGVSVPECVPTTPEATDIDGGTPGGTCGCTLADGTHACDGDCTPGGAGYVCANTCLTPGHPNYRCDTVVNGNKIDLNFCSLMNDDFVELKACIDVAGRISSDVTDLEMIVNPLLTTLPEDLFENSPNFEEFLTELRISNTGLMVLPPGIFVRLRALELLDLSDNNLRTLPVGIFEALESLTYLTLETAESTRLWVSRPECVPTVPAATAVDGGSSGTCGCTLADGTDACERGCTPGQDGYVCADQGTPAPFDHSTPAPVGHTPSPVLGGGGGDDFEVAQLCQAHLGACLDNLDCNACLEVEKNEGDEDNECNKDAASCSELMDNACCDMGDSCSTNAPMVALIDCLFGTIGCRVDNDVCDPNDDNGTLNLEGPSPTPDPYETDTALTCKNGYAFNDQLSACTDDWECMRCICSADADECTASRDPSADYDESGCGGAWFSCLFRDETCSNNSNLVALAECVGEDENCAWDPPHCPDYGSGGMTSNDTPAPTDNGAWPTLTSSGQTISALTCQNGYTWNEFSACTEDLECLGCFLSMGPEECSTSLDSSGSFGTDCSDESVAWYCCVLREEACSNNPNFVALAECIGESEGCAWDPSSCTGAVHSTDNDQPAPTDTSTPRGHEEGGKTSTSSEETSTALTCKDGYTWNELHACTEDLECVTCLYGPGADECRTSPDAADYYELDCSDANAAWLCCVLRDETCAKNAKFAALAECVADGDDCAWGPSSCPGTVFSVNGGELGTQPSSSGARCVPVLVLTAFIVVSTFAQAVRGSS